MNEDVRKAVAKLSFHLRASKVRNRRTLDLPVEVAVVLQAYLKPIRDKSYRKEYTAL